MGKSKGWIKIDRSILDHWIYKSEKFDNLHAFLDILLTCNYTEHEFVSKGQLVKLQPGQLITSVPKLAERWGWSENKVRRFLAVLTEGGVVRTDGSARGSTLTVENWAFYQDQRRARGSADESADGSADGSLYKKEKKGKNNYNVPVSMEETLEAMKRFAKKGGQEA